MQRRASLSRASISRERLLALLLGGLLASACGGGGAKPADVTAPTVLSTVPAAAATGVAVGQAISVVFSEPMNTGTVAASLSPPIDLGAAQWSAGDTVVTFHPPAPLQADTGYALAVSGKDAAGNALAFAGATFRTAPPPVSLWDAALWDQGTWQ